MMQSHRQSEFDVSRIRPRLGGLPHLETFTWQNLIPAERPGYPVWQTGLPALAGHPTHLVNVTKLKRETIWQAGYRTKTGYLTYLGSRVPHLHANSP